MYNRFTSGKSTWFASVNEFVDRTDDEMRMLRGRPQAVPAAIHTLKDSINVENLPDSVDWRDKGVVTPPKNQGGCGSCWAFSTTETVESHVAIATGTLPTLAPQELVSCMENPDECGGTGGCEGATAVLGFGYVSQYGLSSENDYPYAGRDEKCSRQGPTAKVNGTVVLKTNDADALLQAVATVGPVSISVAASTWSFYGGGTFLSLSLSLSCLQTYAHTNTHTQQASLTVRSDLIVMWISITPCNLLGMEKIPRVENSIGWFETRGEAPGVRKDTFVFSEHLEMSLATTTRHLSMGIVVRVELASAPTRSSTVELVESFRNLPIPLVHHLCNVFVVCVCVCVYVCLRTSS
jgi:hypothetical protein